MYEMTIDEIVSADLKNYPPNHHTVEDGIRTIENYIFQGKDIYRQGNSLYVVEKIDDGIEWHTLNADKSLDLLKNTNLFLKEIQEEGYKFAKTYYDNPKILKIVEMFDFPQQTSQVNEGQFKTYKTVVRL
jgi:hypothetical protein